MIRSPDSKQRSVSVSASTRTFRPKSSFTVLVRDRALSAESEESVVNPAAYTRIVVTDIAEEVSVAV